MHIPQIIFRYSTVYDQLFQKEYEVQKETKEPYPTPEKITVFIEILKKSWQEYHKSILEELVRITTLQWKEDKIICYVVGRTLAFSEPLTIPAYSGYEDYAIDVLTHELIHRIFTQEGNYEKALKSWEHIHNTYKQYSENTLLHIPLEAIHTALYMNLFDITRLTRDKEFLSLMPEYKDAWDVVEKEGYKNIIKEFVDRLKFRAR